MIRVETKLFSWGAVVSLALLRLAHINLLWSDEDYHLAAAIQILHARVPYRDFWYDKPPLAALFYALIGGYSGWSLRLLDTLFVLACCWFAYRLAKAWWGESEGLTAALLLAFFTAFYLPSATIPFAVDGLLLLPHFAAVYFARQRQPFWSGVCCAVGLLTNIKAVFVAATCAAWLLGDAAWFGAGLALPLAIAGAVGASLGALPGFYVQVWEWGWIYAKGSASPHAFETAVKHCADWLGFHGALVAGVLVMSRFPKLGDRWKLWVWFAFSFMALLFGNHFAPRYFFQLLPVMVIAGARGIVIGITRYGRGGAAVLAVLLLIPLVRFGPRYLELIRDNVENRKTRWSDAAMDIDSQQTSSFINASKKPGDTLFVWGYRPDDYVYTRLNPPGKFWDSQPLDGVPADRHLESSQSVSTGAAQANRALVVHTRPTFIVDGLGILNPALAPGQFPDLELWLRNYALVYQTPLSRIYRLRSP